MRRSDADLQRAKHRGVFRDTSSLRGSLGVSSSQVGVAKMLSISDDVARHCKSYAFLQTHVTSKTPFQFPQTRQPQV